VLPGAGVGGHASGGNRAVAQGPEKALVPVLADLLALHVRERARDTLIRVVHGAVDRLAILRGQPILLVPDVQRGFLIGNLAVFLAHGLHDGIHGDGSPPFLPERTESHGPSDTISCARGSTRLSTAADSVKIMKRASSSNKSSRFKGILDLAACGERAKIHPLTAWLLPHRTSISCIHRFCTCSRPTGHRLPTDCPQAMLAPAGVGRCRRCRQAPAGAGRPCRGASLAARP